MSTWKKYSYQLLFFFLIILLTLALSSCGSSVADQVLDDQTTDTCPDVFAEFGNLEIIQNEKVLTFSFDVPPICCHHVLVQLYHEGERLSYWESSYEFGGGHRETVTFTSENDYSNGSYEIRIGTGIIVQFSEEFLVT